MNTGLRRDPIEIPYFHEITGHPPYPWQRRFYTALVEGDIHETVDVPTGLGKTLCVLLLLLGRLRNPALPTRIVYVVDRRAIVDQTAEVIRAWIDRIAALPELAQHFDACAAFPAPNPVRLGVLRGGLADDGEWRFDPARPAVIVGTVDMIGSRLLFSGYGDGRWKRPMHAGLLAHDAIVVLDEAHLSPAMDELLRAVARLQGGSRFWSMTLSATHVASGKVLGLSPSDLENESVRRRLHAPKLPCLQPVKTPKERVIKLCDMALEYRTGAIAIFVRSVADAESISSRLIRRLGYDGAKRVALLTGTLRGRERAALTRTAVWQHFRPDRERVHGTSSVYLVTTAAGEVGVDLDADHALMDLSPLDSMIQRIGRVNRAGTGKATITVVFTERDTAPPEQTPKTRREKLHAACQRTLCTLRDLGDLSPGTFRNLPAGTLETCTLTSAQPARLDAAVVEAFSATSAELKLPPVALYLHGLVEEPDIPETFLAWRWDTPQLVALGTDTARTVLSFFRPYPEELARVPAHFAKKLVQRALERQNGCGLPLLVFKPNGEVFAEVVEDETALPPLHFTTIILPPDAGGLSTSGLPDEKAAVEVADVADDGERLRYVAAQNMESNDTKLRELPDWVDDAIELRIPIPTDDQVNAEEHSLVYALHRPDSAGQLGETDISWLGASTQTIDEHCARVGSAARRIGTALRLPAPLVDALTAAGAWHDRGKARGVWQRAAGVPACGPLLAKSPRGRFRPEWLGGYRHEFGSLAEAERALAADVPHRDLILHLIAAHHGWARPGFPKREHWDPDDSSHSNRERAVRTAFRFALLQAQHGPWQLAWLEALVKAADAWVSTETGA